MLADAPVRLAAAEHVRGDHGRILELRPGVPGEIRATRDDARDDVDDRVEDRRARVARRDLLAGRP